MDWGKGLIEDSGKGEFPHFSIIYLEELFNLTVLLRFYSIWVSFYFIFRVFVVSNIHCEIFITDVRNSLLFKSESPLGQSLVKTRKRKILFI